MSLVEIIALFFVMVMLSLVPSTSVALVVARSSISGFLNGSAVAAGIVVGDLIFVVLAILGMAALAEVMGSLFLILKYMAGGYLIWFGISFLKSRPAVREEVAGPSASSLSASFLSGLLLTLGDVKAIFFYASLFPSFVDLAAITTTDIAIIVILTIVAVGGVKLGYAYSAIRVASFAKGFKGERAVKVAAGGFMVGAGVFLIAKA
ncbi:LysE family translocator [Marinomonas fungiae]|uniref:Threonine/homoserine/homoserine lactone efflux protein n=1 Tax=Marinomonas fungiae TaxID=1137284 RepID=A0A0K6INQ3_9GAMM|nr:LysE family translocator [Marinomonas fungiae]CUB04745.1 Threonine/homoserine/homoserine lactone efflux protein [Marinomonas fungiae]